MLDKPTYQPADWLDREPPFAIDDCCFQILQTKVVKANLGDKFWCMGKAELCSSAIDFLYV